MQTSRPMQFEFHYWGLLLILVVTAMTVAVAGSLLMVSQTEKAGRLLLLTATLGGIACFFVWLITPSQILDLTFKHTWTQSGRESFWQLPIYPLAFSAQSALLLAFSLSWSGKSYKERVHRDSSIDG